MLIDFGVPLSIIFIFLTLGFHVRLVAFNAWLLLLPKVVALLHTSHFAIYYTSFDYWRILISHISASSNNYFTIKKPCTASLFKLNMKGFNEKVMSRTHRCILFFGVLFLCVEKYATIDFI
jgi:hypothetical protein